MSDTMSPEQEKLASEVANARFISNLETEEGRSKIAQEATPYIKQRLREEAFSRKILRPVAVTKSEVQRAVDHDTVEKICAMAKVQRSFALGLRISKPGAGNSSVYAPVQWIVVCP